MLRASIEAEGGEVDLQALTDGAAAEASGISGAAALVGLTEAVLGGETAEIAKARDRVREEFGSAGLVDAAAVIGNFERMVRIADATGIPLDAPVAVATESIRADLGIDAYASARQTGPIGGWQRVLGRVVEPVVRAVLRWRGRRSPER